MRAAVVSGLLLCLCTGLTAKEEVGVSCDLRALRFESDGRLLKIYDGLRGGLEKAHLGRVCLASVEAPGPALDKLVLKLEAEREAARAGQRAVPVAFAFGEGAARALAGRAPDVPRVFVVVRYTVAGKPLHPLPKPTGVAAVLFAELRMERVGAVLAGLAGHHWPRVRLAWEAVPPKAVALLDRAAEVAGLRGLSRHEPLSGAERPGSKPGGEPKLDALLHLRLGVGETLLPFARAVRMARKLGVPLVTDDPLRYRQGLATVVLGLPHQLVGRYAAEAARVLTQHPVTGLKPRAVPNLRVLVDLDAADRQGFTLPLPFLARASELFRGLRPARAPGPRDGR